MNVVDQVELSGHLDKEKTKHVFVLLDGLRGVAAIAVATRHMTAFFPRWLPGSHMAVDLFFILSGFVIAYAYDHKIRDGLTTRKFVAFRLLRLWPVFFLAVFINFPFAIMKSVISGDGIIDVVLASLLALAMLPTPFGPKPFPTVGAAWSLMFELIVNFLYALFWRKLSSQVLSIITVASALVFIATSLQLGKTDFGFTWHGFFPGLSRAMFGFTLGVLLFRFKHRFSNLPLIPFPFIVALLLVTMIPENLNWYIFATIFLMPLAVLFCIPNNYSPKSFFIYMFLGEISYVIYLIHKPISDGLGYVVLNYLPWLGYLERFCIGLTLLIAFLGASFLISRVYDRPLREYIGRHLN